MRRYLSGFGVAVTEESRVATPQQMTLRSAHFVMSVSDEWRLTTGFSVVPAAVKRRPCRLNDPAAQFCGS